MVLLATACQRGRSPESLALCGEAGQCRETLGPRAGLFSSLLPSFTFLHCREPSSCTMVPLDICKRMKTLEKSRFVCKSPAAARRNEPVSSLLKNNLLATSDSDICTAQDRIPPKIKTYRMSSETSVVSAFLQNFICRNDFLPKRPRLINQEVFSLAKATLLKPCMNWYTRCAVWTAHVSHTASRCTRLVGVGVRQVNQNPGRTPTHIFPQGLVPAHGP